MTGHPVDVNEFYNARLARCFKHSPAIARRQGQDPAAITDSTEVRAALHGALPGSVESAERVAAAIEGWFLAAHQRVPGPGYWPDLIRYEGALFRTDSIQTGERQTSPNTPGGRPIHRAASARIIALDHDMPSLVMRLDRLVESDPIPWAVPAKPTRLLIAMSPKGDIRVVRASDALEGFLKTVDGQRDFDLVVASSGIDRESAAAALKSLIDIGAVEE